MKLKQMSLVNILAGRELVPEFMPFYRSTAPISAVALHLLADPAAREALREDMENVLAPLRRQGAHRRTAGIIGEMLSERGFTPAQSQVNAQAVHPKESDAAVPKSTATSQLD
jgi:hypothetical protein